MTFVHKEYPRVLHKAGGLVSPEVWSDEERDAKLAEGWSLLPVADVPEPVRVAEPDGGIVLDETPAAEPVKRGRKKKTETVT